MTVDEQQNAPGIIDVRIIAVFCDPEQIVWVGGFATL
jgi:hypothetical protein